VITAICVAAALMLTPAADTPSPVKKGQKVHDSPISLYQGRYYVKADNKKRLCIRQKESRHAHGAVSASGKYRGAYQASAEMAVGMGWMVQKELRATGTPKAKAVAIGEILRDTQMNRWAPYYQSMGFWLAWNHGKGASHWPTRAGC
jgi:hypothetical protein